MLVIQCSSSAWLETLKNEGQQEKPDTTNRTITASPNKMNNRSDAKLVANSKISDSIARVRIKPLDPLRLSTTSQKDKDLRMQSMSLSDTWNFILQDFDQYDTSFSRLLRDEENISKESKSKKAASKKKSKPPRTLYSVSWSIALSTATIIAMTSAKSFATMVKSSGVRWETLPNLIPLLLSAEHEIGVRIRNYAYRKFLPIGWQTMEKMILMEIWRSIWLKTFRSLRDAYTHFFGVNYYETLWETYAPGWIRRGVRSYFVKILQGRLQNVIYGWITRGWEVVSIGFGSWWLEFELIEDGDFDMKDGDREIPGLIKDEDIEIEIEFEDSTTTDLVEADMHDGNIVTDLQLEDATTFKDLVNEDFSGDTDMDIDIEDSAGSVDMEDSDLISDEVIDTGG